MAVTFQPSFQPKIRFEWINESWQLVVANLGTWILAVLIVGIIAMISSYACLFAFGVMPQIMRNAMTYGAPANPLGIYLMPGYWASVAVTGVVSAFLISGLYRMVLAQLRGQQLSVAILFQPSPTMWAYVGYHIVASIAISIGFALCILPGLVVAALLMPGYAMVTDGVPVGEALSRSSSAVSKDWLQGGVFVLVYGLIYLASCIPCGLGAFVTLPMLLIICGLMYRDMIGMPGGFSGTPTGPNYYQPAQPGVWPPPPGAPMPPSNPYAPSSASPYPPSAPTYPPAQQGGAPQQWPPGELPPAYPPLNDLEGDTGTSPPEGSV